MALEINYFLSPKKKTKKKAVSSKISLSVQYFPVIPLGLQLGKESTMLHKKCHRS